MKAPYDKYKNLKIWKLLSKCLKELERNNDIQMTTHPDYAVGYLINRVFEQCKKEMVDK